MICCCKNVLLLKEVFKAIVSNSVVRNISSTSEDILVKSTNNKGIIILNRPKALNTLNLFMIRKLYSVLKEWELKNSMVIMKSAGGKAFCAGGDVRSVIEAGEKSLLYKDFFREGYMLISLIGTYQKPSVAFIDGITMGGGVGITVNGKYRVATEKTVFAMPETAIGFFPDVGSSYFLSRLGGKLGLYLALTGKQLRGIDVLRAGLATHFVDSDILQHLEMDLLNLKHPESEIEQILDKYNVGCDKGQEFSLAPHLPKMNDYFSASSVEEIFSVLEKDDSDWSKETLKTLKNMSPTSLKVTFKQLEEGSTKNLQECLAMEYRLTQRFCKEHDFYEGVRAVLIDKDNNPKWNPASLEEISSSKIALFFDPLPENEELVL